MDKLIRILPTAECNPEFAPDKESQEGIECSGFLLMTFAGDELQSVHLSGVSTKKLTDAIRDNCMDEVIGILRQAMAVAEGYIKAAEIFGQMKRDSKMQLLRKLFEGEDGEDE